MNRPALWTSAEIAAATGGKATAPFEARGVSIDSRAIAAGDLFIAVKGPNFDGNDFARAAIMAGAAGALVSKPMQAGLPCVVVEDSLKALNDLAKAARARASARIAAITGSVGKTSTKEMLARALSVHGRCFATSGNLNNQWGAPLSLARMEREAAFGVFELGMNHAGEISPLSKLARPHVAIITWVAAAHLEFFASIEEIAKAKAEIFDGLEAGGVAILPRDNEHFALLCARASAKGARIISFGEHEAADCRLLSHESGASESRIEAWIEGRRINYRLAILGRHQAMNSLSVAAAISAFGLDVEPALQSLAAIAPMAGRGKRELVRLGAGAIELIDESYNASPASMRAALRVLAAIPAAKGGRKIAVLGDMRELGFAASRLHADLAEDVARSGADMAFLVGPHMLALHERLPAGMAKCHRADSLAMVEPLVAALGAGDLVLVKGSLGTGMKPLVEAVRRLGEAGPALRAGNGS